jgi:hypothetical protein
MPDNMPTMEIIGITTVLVFSLIGLIFTAWCTWHGLARFAKYVEAQKKQEELEREVRG